jgi:acetyltransferase-like isoleucine patch superfamily enzyme
MNSFLQKIFFRIIPVEVIEHSLAELKIRRCKEAVTIGEKSRFYEEAKVVNLRRDNSCIVIGEGTHIRGELVTFAFGGQIHIGSNTYIGEGSIIRSAEKISIGDNVLISHNCNIIDTDSHEMNYLERASGFKNIVTKGHSKEQGSILCKPIHIADYAWISYNVSILKGVTIGRGAIVGAGSIVTKDVPEFTIVAGNPAKIIRKVEA